MSTSAPHRARSSKGSIQASRWTFRQTLKEPAVEELVNRYWHRPLAFLLILRPLERIRLRHGVTPNHLTMFSGLFGLSGGLLAYAAAQQGQFLLLVAGTLLLVSVVFDCSDGMLARLTGQSSRLGMLLDGFMDFFVGLVFWFGLTHSLVRLVQPNWGWPLAAVVLMTCVVHAGLYDQFKNLFARSVSPSSRAPELGRAVQRGSCSGAAWAFDRIYQLAYGSIGRVFAGRSLEPKQPLSPEEFRETFSSPMQWFACLGLGSHLFVIYLATFLGAIAPTFAWYFVLIMILGVLNVVMVLAIVSWRRAASRVCSGAS